MRIEGKKKLTVLRILAAAGLFTLLESVGMWPLTLRVQAGPADVIQICYFYDNGKMPISDAEFSCVRIADAGQEGSTAYIMREPYSRNGRNTAETDPEMAEKYLRLYQKYEEGTALVRTTSEKGTCRFSDCSPGLYLIWQSGAEGDAEGYEMSKPLVVSSPSYENGKAVSLTAVYPKTSRKPEESHTVMNFLKPKRPENKPSESAKEEEKVSLEWQPIPEIQPEADDMGQPEEDPSQYRKGGATGDESHMLLWLGVACSSLTGMAAVLIAIRIRRRKSRYFASHHVVR